MDTEMGDSRQSSFLSEQSLLKEDLKTWKPCIIDNC